MMKRRKKIVIARNEAISLGQVAKLHDRFACAEIDQYLQMMYRVFKVRRAVILSPSKDARRGLCPLCFDWAQHDSPFDDIIYLPSEFRKLYLWQRRFKNYLYTTKGQ